MSARTLPIPPPGERHLYQDPTPPIVEFRGRWRILSNFFPCEFTHQGTVWASSEHAFNAYKTLDPGQRAWVADAEDPAVAKNRGREVTLRPGWDDHVRFKVMDSVLAAKFGSHPARGEALLSTGTALLVETTRWHDQTWGDCVCGRPACAALGQNHLGRALMRLRHRAQQHTAEAGPTR